jgi:hypothetical protein
MAARTISTAAPSVIAARSEIASRDIARAVSRAGGHGSRDYREKWRAFGTNYSTEHSSPNLPNTTPALLLACSIP